LHEGVIKSNDDEFLMSESELNYNRLSKSEREFAVKVSQPKYASQPVVTETVFTKNSKLTDGFSLLTLHHPVEHQFEAPFSYADEHSTLFGEPDERMFDPIWNHQLYYQDTTVVAHGAPTVLVQRPIAGWPPANLNNGGIVANPWNEVESVAGFNENLHGVLSDSSTFQFGNTVFTSAGTTFPAG
jgi:hypothetical protein